MANWYMSHFLSSCFIIIAYWAIRSQLPALWLRLRKILFSDGPIAPFSLSSFRPDDVRCIYRMKLDKRCYRHPDVNTRKWANATLNTLRQVDPSSPSFRDELRAYASYNLCSLHRDKLEDLDYVIRSWHEEMKAEWDKRQAAIEQSRTSFQRHESIHSHSRSTFSSSFMERRRIPGAYDADDWITDEEILEEVESSLSPNNVFTPDRSPSMYGSATGRDPPLGTLSDSYFRKYQTRGLKSLQEIIKRPLKRLETKPGFIYIYRRPDDDSHVKIGHTGDIRQRISGHRSQCRSSLILIFRSGWIPNAKRVELLIHTELEMEDLRTWDLRCVKRPSRCGKRHKEWFNTEPDRAMKVARHWIKWMMDCAPYNHGESSELKIEYVRCINGAKAFDGLLSHRELFDRDSKGHSWLRDQSSLSVPEREWASASHDTEQTDLTPERNITHRSSGRPVPSHSISEPSPSNMSSAVLLDSPPDTPHTRGTERGTERGTTGMSTPSRKPRKRISTQNGDTLPQRPLHIPRKRRVVSDIPLDSDQVAGDETTHRIFKCLGCNNKIPSLGKLVCDQCSSNRRRDSRRTVSAPTINPSQIIDFGSPVPTAPRRTNVAVDAPKI